MKILISAYSCEPNQGSERGVGWNIVCQVAKYHQVWVLTRPDESKAAIEAELARHSIPNLKFVYFTLPFWQDSLRWGQAGAMQIHYYLWQIQAYFVARRLHREIGFNIIHHVTFVKYSSPSFLSLLPVPFIWGPVGGGETYPIAFWQDFSLQNKVYETFRSLTRWIGQKDPFTQATAKQSAVAYAVTEETAKRVSQMGAKSVKIFPAIGLSQTEIERLAQYPLPNRKPVRFVSIARLLHWKGIHLGLKAFAKANLLDSEYWILGDGPETAKLQQLTLDLEISKRIKFWGLLDRDEVLYKLERCSILIHPSLHDSGAGVCLEAMAAGRPVICLDLGGPAQQVTLETGFKIPARNPEQVITSMAAKMSILANDHNLLIKMGRLSQQRVIELYSWEAKGKQLFQTYQEVIKCTF
ncbi:glycosyltransferase family 4 protein [Myxosarcina sp. GI1]|uniref:glycosyltransferase family 4 protein n=1 Tax=Myxosarcina sp. GI1 TaxID=1541065 RepID=UPI00056AA0CF|nr:glycosyltransferase family 4 protein [Myxosarcina sp. GI1]